MRAKIIITAEGKISIITQEGSFEEGSVGIERLLSKLGAQGLEIDGAKEYEQHRHDHEHTKVKLHY